MRHGSLFSGIGGFDLASEWMGWENVFQVEWDSYCQKVLTKNFPDVKRYGDIKEFDGTGYRGLIDILTGGFPCQGFSVAGKQRGKDDPRWLWPEMLRVIREIHPPWIVGENVPGIIKLALEDICASLEGEGYAVQPVIIPACAVNAPHKRDRVWFVAYADSKHREKPKQRNKLENESKEKSPGWNFYDTIWNRKWTDVASEIYRMDDGLSCKLDASKRITALGNAIVPQVAYEIFKAISSIHENNFNENDNTSTNNSPIFFEGILSE